MPCITTEPENGLALAPPQRWYSRVYSGESRNYAVMSLTADLPPGTSRAAVRDALATMIARHDILRTEFRDGPAGLRQQLCDAGLASARTLADMRLREVAAPGGLADARARAGQLAAQQCLAGIPVTAAPLLRAVLVRAGGPPGQAPAVLAVACHHLVFDGASARLFSGELAGLLDGARLAPAPSYRELSAALAAREQAGADSASQAYWARTLAGLSVGCHLPRQPGPLPPAMQYRLTWPDQLRAAVRDAARQARVTEFAIRAAAYLALCHTIYVRDDVLVVMPVDLRGRTAPAAAVGMLVNFVPLRHRLRPGETAGELVRDTAAGIAQTFRHGSCALDRIAAGSADAGYDGRFPLTGALINASRAPEIEEAPARAAVLEPAGRRTAFDCQLYFTDAPGRVDMTFQFSPAVIQPRPWADLAESYATLLAAICHEPGRPLQDVLRRAGSTPAGASGR